MKILHRYIFYTLLKNFGICVFALVLLFSLFDFLERIDNIAEEGASLGLTIEYFLYKIPLTMSLMLPAAALTATLFTVGMLAKNSELTAMRAAGLRVTWLLRPVLIFAVLLSVCAIVFNETVVPYSTRRTKEIYNIDIKQKDERGVYSQAHFWWRSEDAYYSAAVFDSRSDTLLGVSLLEVNDDGKVRRRIIADRAKFLGPTLGWSMQSVNEYVFSEDGTSELRQYPSLPLAIRETPKDFYNVETDPNTMSFGELRQFIAKQKQFGLSVTGYLADLYAKISFPFVIFIMTLVAIPFALIPARTGSMAKSFLAGILLGFSYYAVHSLSIAMGRAEFWPPLLAAWMANLLLGAIGVLLNLGSESPS